MCTSGDILSVLVSKRLEFRGFEPLIVLPAVKVVRKTKGRCAFLSGFPVGVSSEDLTGFHQNWIELVDLPSGHFTVGRQKMVHL